MRTTKKLALALALLAANAANALAAWPHQPAVNLPVCTATNTQGGHVAVSDGAGGVIVAWQDLRGGSYDIYAQHVLASGVVDPAWPVNGKAVCTSANSQFLPAIVADGAGGAIVAWQDGVSGITWDIYAQHVLASGALDPAWTAGGRVVCATAGDQSYPGIASDGAGGAIVAWQDSRSGANTDIYAQHVPASGAVDPAWPADGRALCTAANNQSSLKMISLDGGGAIVVWADARSGTSSDIYAQRVLASGVVDPAWPLDGRAVFAGANDQSNPAIVGDGAGGAFVTWQDFRDGVSYDVYAHHVLPGGTLDGTWRVDGLGVYVGAGSQGNPAIAADGAGGAIITWVDFRSGTYSDIYAQRVLPAGSVDETWPGTSLLVCGAANSQLSPAILADGAGGAIITWVDTRTNSRSDIYAQHLYGTGTVDPGWPADGRALSTASNEQLNPVIVTDGAGGAIVSFADYRSGNADVYAQRVAKYGYLGTPESEMAGVKDVPNDNGGRVKVSWTASYLELDPYLGYFTYYVFRSVPPQVAARTIAREVRLRAAGDAALQPGDLISTLEGTTTLFWEMVTSLSGMNIPGYSFVATTSGDSIGAGNPRTLFMVQARTSYQFWNSRPDSGYSVDNIPPVTPAPFAANYAAGTTHLHWSPNPDADLAGYRLYRGVGAFVPGPASLLASPADTGWADAASATWTYKLTAVDVHGNESPVATVSPTAIAGVGDGVTPRELALAPASPNPANRGTTLRFALPVGANVSLGVYDAAGRLVRSLANGALWAGEHAAAWDLRDGAGRAVGAGLYFARLDVAGRTITRPIAVTH